MVEIVNVSEEFTART